jgi:pyridoxamine 5'-phosphate oxidase
MLRILHPIAQPRTRRPSRVGTVEHTEHLDLASLREEYARGGLDVPDLAGDPVTMFRRWLDDAAAAGLHEPNAMVLATVSGDGQPAARMVLLKGLDDAGFVFFTNQASRKGVELAANPRCSLLFPWHPLERQVRVDGTATPLPAPEVAAYFASRPRGAQLGAWASRQSRPVASRAELAASYAAVQERFGDDVPVPEEWGGYVVAPEAVEFWQGRPGRMHDRLVYRRTGPAWWIERLAP